MTSSSGSSHCPSGYRTDDFFWYTPDEPCGLLQTLHYTLMCIWTIMYLAALMEVTWSSLLGAARLPRMVKGLYIGWLLALIVLCFYVVANPQASVTRSLVDSCTLWVSYWLSTACIMGALLTYGVTLIRTAAISSSLSEIFDSTLPSVFWKMDQYVIYLFCSIVVVFTAAGFVLLAVLTQILESAAQKQISVNTFFILFGVVLILCLFPMLVYMLKVRQAALHHAQFRRQLPNSKDPILSHQTDLVEQLSRRLTWQVGVVCVQLGSSLIFVLCGALFKPQYLFVHFSLGPVSFGTIIVFLLLSRSSVLGCLWGRDWYDGLDDHSTDASILTNAASSLAAQSTNASASGGTNDTNASDLTSRSSRNLDNMHQPASTTVDFAPISSNESMLQHMISQLPAASQFSSPYGLEIIQNNLADF